MIQLQNYRSLSDTARGLAEALKRFQPADPLVDQTIIVPNMDTARWLKLELAEIRGVSANLSMILPSDWQYRQIRRLYPNLPKKLPSDILPMTWSLFELLFDEKAGKAYPILADYIRRQSSANRETAIWQLSSQIASVLDQYLVYRPELLLSWQSGRIGKSTDEQWQAKLWNQLNSRWKGLSDPGFHKNRAELHRDLLRKLQKGEIDCSEPLFVFNPGLVPAPILHSIKNYSQQQEVLFLYSTPLQIEELKSELNPMNTPLSPPPEGSGQALLGGSLFRGEFLDSFGQEALELEQLYREHFGPVEPIGRGRKDEPGDQVGQVESSGRAEPNEPVGEGDQTGSVGHIGQAGEGEQGQQVGPGGQMNFTAGLDDSISNQQREMTNLSRIQESVLLNEPLRSGGNINESAQDQASIRSNEPFSTGDISDKSARLQGSDQLNTPAKTGSSNDGSDRVQESNDSNEPFRAGDIADGSARMQEPDRKDKTAKAGRPGDGSIRIHSCHSPLREIETLYHSLLEMFEQDVTLAPDDVLVATPDPELYEPFIKAVFGTVEDGLPVIPWHLGSSGGRENTVEKSVRLWLEIPDSRFRIQPVLDLFSMQPVCDNAGISESDVNEVRNWMTENSVMWGLDANHREELGQPPSGAQTWHSAVKRGWLGQWMADEPGQFYEDTLLYTGIRTSAQKEAWAAFSQYLNRLDRAHQEIKKSRTGGEWCDWIEEKLEKLIGPESLMEQDGSTVRNALDLIRESCETVVNQKEVSFSMIRSVILSLLDRKSSAGALFTRGVTFSSMVPVRSIPFRVIALIGLNESTFPRKETVIDFDLMAQQPKTGERNRKHEDRNLFLESVLSASDIHYLSYVGQSPVDNEEIPPSTIVTEWIDLVSAVSGSDRDEVVQKEALHLFSESYFREQRIYSGLAHRTASNLKKQDKTTSGLLLDLKKEPEEGQGNEFSLDRFIRFFKNPVRAYVTDKMGAFLRSPEEEKDEFSLNHLERHLLFQKMMGWLITGMDETDILLLIRKAGLVPDGWVGESLISELLAHCKSALNFLKSRGEKPRFSELKIDLQIGDLTLNETIISFKDHSLLDIEASKLSGAMLIQSWIRHLVWQASTGREKPSNLLSDLKKGEPKWSTFMPVQNPEETLRKLVQLYQKGQFMPLLFFPRSLYAFREAEDSVKKADPLAAAANEFEGGDFSYGERNDLSIQMLLGAEAPFDPGFLEDEFLSVVNEMFEHLEVL